MNKTEVKSRMKENLQKDDQSNQKNQGEKRHGSLHQIKTAAEQKTGRFLIKISSNIPEKKQQQGK